MALSHKRRLFFHPSPWLVLLPAYALLNVVSPFAVRWGFEPGHNAQGLAIEMTCLMASYGAVVGQWSVLAAWSALGPQRWPVSLAFSWASASVLFALYLGALVRLQTVDVGTWDVRWVPLALLAIQAPLLALRLVLGWRLHRDALTMGRNGFRFTILDLLTLTGAIAVILAVNRGVTAHGFYRGIHHAEACACFALIGYGLVAPSLRSLFAVLRVRAAIAALFAALFGAIACATAVSWSMAPRGSFATCASIFAGPVLGGWSEPNGGQSIAQLLLAVVGLVGSWAVVAIPSLLVFRLVGYRLARRYRVALVSVDNDLPATASINSSHDGG